MANWCMNRVEFKANETQMKKIEQLFLQLSLAEFETKHGQLPDFAMDERGFMHDIEFEDGVLTYQTKWSPNTEVVLSIGKHFNVDLEYNFEEYGMEIFGFALFENGTFTLFELDQMDMQQISFNQATSVYTFEGSDYELIDEIVETLLFRKRIAQGGCSD